jgi:hypothetical protein
MEATRTLIPTMDFVAVSEEADNDLPHSIAEVEPSHAVVVQPSSHSSTTLHPVHQATKWYLGFSAPVT